MTEQEWLACETPDLLLRHLKSIGVTRAARGRRRRRLRLLGCAAFRQIEHLLTDCSGRRAIELAERYADGEVELTDLQSLAKELLALPRPKASTPQWTAESVVPILLTPNDLIVAEQSLEQTVWAHHAEAKPAKPNVFRRVVRKLQTPLVRDIFGNPFRPVPTIVPSWLSSNDGLVRRLAQSAYQERAFDRLPILSDALEDAGCEDAAILSHLRSAGPHVRGCWVVDLLLGMGEGG